MMMKKLSFCLILSVCTFGLGLVSCVEPNHGSDIVGDHDPESLQGSIVAAIQEINGVESDVSRGLLLRSLRENDRQEIEDTIYHLKLALHRLYQDQSDSKALHHLRQHTLQLKKRQLLQVDEERMKRVVNANHKVLKKLNVEVNEELFRYDFTSHLGDFRYLATVGTTIWEIDGDRGVAKASGFMQGVSESWMFSPRFDLSLVKEPNLQIRQSIGFFNSWEEMEVLASSNYEYGHPDSADWQVLEIKRRPRGDVNWEAVTSEEISLSEYAGQQLVIAFRYRSKASAAATWQIDFFTINGVVKELDEMNYKPVNPSLELVEPGDRIYSTILENSFATTLEPFENFTTEGKAEWKIDSNRKFAIVNGFKLADRNVSWLISSPLDLSAAEEAYFEFEQSVGHFVSWDELKVMVSSNFAGDPETADWQEIAVEKKPDGVKFWEWLKTERLRLDEFLGEKVVIAFRYESNKYDKATTWQIRNLKVSAAFQE